MSQDIIKSEIDELFETMREQWDIIKAYEDKIPYIELDILMQNVRKFYEDIYLIEKMNKAPGFDATQIRQKITRESPIPFKIQRPAETEELKPSAEVAIPILSSVAKPFEKEEKSKAVVPEPTTMAPTEQPDVVHFPVEDDQKDDSSQYLSETGTNKTSEIKSVPETISPQNDIKPLSNDLFGGLPPQTVADKYRDERKTINEKLNKVSSDSSIGAKMQFSQLGDLKTAIGINDKFLFINELFKGDLSGYNNAISRLNACTDRNEAIQMIEQMAQLYKWNLQSTSVQRLNQFVIRRFTD